MLSHLMPRCYQCESGLVFGTRLPLVEEAVSRNVARSTTAPMHISLVVDGRAACEEQGYVENE